MSDAELLETAVRVAIETVEGALDGEPVRLARVPVTCVIAVDRSLQLLKIAADLLSCEVDAAAGASLEEELRAYLRRHVEPGDAP